MLQGNGFLGTAATLGADVSLLMQILFYIAICVAVVAQRRRKYHWHDRIMTTVVVGNLFFIIFIMMSSFAREDIAGTLPQRPDDPHFSIPGIHAVLGLLAEGFAIYSLLAGRKILPRKIGRLRYWMWTTFAFWTLAFAVGLGTYYRWYVVEANPVADVTAVLIGEDGQQATPEGGGVQRTLLQNFAFAPQDLTVVAGTTVVWLNQDSAPHNVALGDNNVVSENFFQGESFELTFEEVGNFPVYCTLHGNPTSGMAGVVNVVEATEENVAQVAQAAAAQPAPVPPPPTPAPSVPPAPVALIAPSAAGDEVAGILSFRDFLGASDSVIMTLQNIAPVAGELVLHVWLTTAAGEVLDLGVVKPDATNQISFVYSDPERRNLMARFDGVQVTAERGDDDDPAPGEVLYSGRQAAAAYEQIRTITVAADTPDGRGFGIGARLQAEELIRHATFVQLAADLGSIADARRHAEHIINILEGEGGQFFADHDGAHGLQNPGNGFGLISYIEQMKVAAAAAAAAPDATGAIETHAGHVAIASDSSLAAATAIRQTALAIVAARGVGEIDGQVEELLRLSQRVLLGEDTNGDGNVSLAEGGIFIAYQHAQYMGAVGIVSGDSAAVVEPIPLGESQLTAQIAAGEVVVDLFDFDYGPESLTIPAGTAVRFLNVGQSLHSATADDSSFDTGLFAGGAEAIVNFDEPGFFPYFCQLHGNRGGVGMAAAITVVEPGAGETAVEPTPAPAEPEATAIPERILEMLDFTYSQVNLVVPQGATVTWFNTGEAPHSVTADDGSFDTGLLDNGGQSTLTFDTPGTHPYYCILHGAPGGEGMAGTITVQGTDDAPP